MDLIIITLSVAFIALVFGFILTYFAEKFKVKENPKISEVYNELPNNNCGACGFASCEAYAKAVVKNPEINGSCIVGGHATANRISKILGVKVTHINKKKTARVHCQGDCQDSYEYQGLKSCKGVMEIGSFKECRNGCIGFGDCVSVCKYNAIKIIEGVAVTNEKCIGCGKCVQECPQKLIELVSIGDKVTVGCNSKELIKKRVKACKSSCSGCGICANICPKNAIEMISEEGAKNKLPRIDYEKCISCGACVKKCPRQVIMIIED